MDLTAADEKLLKALAIAIVDHPRATFKEIAQAAGVSKATLNRFCGTRDQGESVNILLNFTQFFETRIEGPLQNPEEIVRLRKNKYKIIGCCLFRTTRNGHKKFRTDNRLILMK